MLAFALGKHNQEGKLLSGRGMDSHTACAKAQNWLFPLVSFYGIRVVVLLNVNY